MSCKCNSNPCCCNKKRFRGNVDVKQVPGPQGPPGQDGADGADGAQGPAGPAGGMTDEAYINFDEDYTWTQIEGVITGVTHNVSADGDYQIHVDSSSFFQSGLDPNSQLRLYVNGVAVVTQNPVAPAEVNATTVQKNMSMNYRATGMLTGQTIEVRAVLGSAIAGTTTKVNLLINKEA